MGKTRVCFSCPSNTQEPAERGHCTQSCRLRAPVWVGHADGKQRPSWFLPNQTARVGQSTGQTRYVISTSRSWSTQPLPSSPKTRTLGLRAWLAGSGMSPCQSACGEPGCTPPRSWGPGWSSQVMGNNEVKDRGREDETEVRLQWEKRRRPRVDLNPCSLRGPDGTASHGDTRARPRATADLVGRHGDAASRAEHSSCHMRS